MLSAGSHPSAVFTAAAAVIREGSPSSAVAAATAAAATCYLPEPSTLYALLRHFLLLLDAEMTGEGDIGVKGPFNTTVDTGGLRKLPGGSGGEVLTLSIVHSLGEPKLVLWASTTAKFSSKG